MKAQKVPKHLETLHGDREVMVIPKEYYSYIKRYGSNIGARAEAILLRLGCGEEDVRPPSDERFHLDDLRRCLRLTHEFSELRDRIGELADWSPLWRELAEAWVHLEKAHYWPGTGPDTQKLEDMFTAIKERVQLTAH